VMLSALGVFGFDKDKNERFIQYLLLGGGASTTLAMLLFMVFLRSLCAYLSKPLLGSDALNLVMYLVIQIITFPILIFSLRFIFGFGLSAVGTVGAMGFMFILSIVWFAQYYYLFFTPMLRLLGNIREVIEPKRKKDDDDDEEDEEEEEDEDDD
jgi:CBS domain containing-hemolysin-like protein